MNLKIYAILFVYFVFHGALYSSDYSVTSPTFNSGGGIQENGSLGNNHALGEAVIPTIRTSARFNLSSGFINALYTGDKASDQFRLVYNQSIQSEEDTPISIKLTGNERVKSYSIKEFPRHGTLTGVPPDLVYEPSRNFYGEDFFIFHGYIDGKKTEDAIGGGIPDQIRGAVKRNKIKRRLRNIVNEAVKKISINLNYSYLVIAKITMLNKEYTVIKDTLFQDLKKIK